jgi:hypothetical protein
MHQHGGSHGLPACMLSCVLCDTDHAWSREAVPSATAAAAPAPTPAATPTPALGRQCNRTNWGRLWEDGLRLRVWDKRCYCCCGSQVRAAAVVVTGHPWGAAEDATGRPCATGVGGSAHLPRSAHIAAADDTASGGTLAVGGAELPRAAGGSTAGHRPRGRTHVVDAGAGVSAAGAPTQRGPSGAAHTRPCSSKASG